MVLIACRAAEERQPADEHWTAQTMLGAAFDTGDAAAARDVLRGMRRQLIPGWKIALTANDLVESLALLPPAADRAELEAVLAEVRALAP